MSPTLEDRLRATMRAHVPTEPPTDDRWEEIVAAGDDVRARHRRSRITTTVVALVGAAALIVAALVVVRDREADQGRRLDTATPGEIAGIAPAPPTPPTAVAVLAVMQPALDLAHALENEGLVAATATAPGADPTPTLDARAATDAAATQLRTALDATTLPPGIDLTTWRDRFENRMRGLATIRTSVDQRGSGGAREQFDLAAADVAAVGFVLVAAAPTGRSGVDLAAVTGLALDTAGASPSNGGGTPTFLLFASDAQRQESERSMAASPGDPASAATLTARQSLESRLLAGIDWAPQAGASADDDAAIIGIVRAGAALESGLASRALGAPAAPYDTTIDLLAADWTDRINRSGLPDADPSLRAKVDDATAQLERLGASNNPVEVLVTVVAADEELARLTSTGAVARRVLVGQLIERDLAATTGLAVQVVSSWSELPSALGPSEGGSPATVAEERIAVVQETLGLLVTEGEAQARRDAPSTDFDDAHRRVHEAAQQATAPTVALAAYRAAALRAVEADRSLIAQLLA